jgi:Icc-related predicted phosphoesterase
VRIRVLSDLHLEFADFRPPPVQADVVVLAGDIHVGIKGVAWARQEFPDVPVLYVPGNHEYYRGAIPRLLDKLRHEASGSNVRILEQESITVAGVRFAGCTLWTDMALIDDDPQIGMAASSVMSDFKLIRVSPKHRRLRPEDTVAFHHQSRRWLQEQLQGETAARVVISHHAPLPESLHPDYAGDRSNAAYASNLRGLLQQTKPCLWIHGHVHYARDYRLGSTRVVSNPRGYPREMAEGFQPELVVELDDAAPANRLDILRGVSR